MLVSGGLFDLEELAIQLAEYQDEMMQPGFWEDNQHAQEIIEASNQAKKIYENYHDLKKENEELKDLYELVAEDEEGEEIKGELEEALTSFSHKIKTYERNLLLSGPHDACDALLEIHPGAGGTESQDWASMLLRMYQRWADQQGFTFSILDYQPGDEAGIKSVSVEVKGYNVYGFLKSEHGVHRLVRISPFDANKRRHTSFASVEVMPEITQETEIEINPDDLRIDVYRSSGAGGQHINKTSSAVRITHLPTNTVVTSQSQRSQFQNRETAMKVLKAKLAHLLEEKNAKELDEIRGEKSEIAWGAQIRSYVFHPYQMVKDHRTNYEEGNSDKVMDGASDGFVDAYLKNQLGE